MWEEKEEHGYIPCADDVAAEYDSTGRTLALSRQLHTY
jgi:hypothetical protein